MAVYQYKEVTREVGPDGSLKETERTTQVWPEPGQVPEAPPGFKNPTMLSQDPGEPCTEEPEGTSTVSEQHDQDTPGNSEDDCYDKNLNNSKDRPSILANTSRSPLRFLCNPKSVKFKCDPTSFLELNGQNASLSVNQSPPSIRPVPSQPLKPKQAQRKKTEIWILVAFTVVMIFVGICGILDAYDI